MFPEFIENRTGSFAGNEILLDTWHNSLPDSDGDISFNNCKAFKQTWNFLG